MADKQDYYRKPWQLVHGVPIIWAFAQNWERIENFQARSDDIVIATYPKAGTTWMSEIVDMIMHAGDEEQSKRDFIFNKVPMLEVAAPNIMMTGTEQLGQTPPPRMIKTHLPVSLLPKSFWEKKSKVVYVARNAKDLAVSYYHFDLMNQLHPEPGTWEEYLEKYMAGNAGYGSWYDHVKDWWEKRASHPILYMFYEDMKEDPKREIRKVAKFLGKEFSEDVLDNIVHHTSFEAMKENPLTNYETTKAAFFLTDTVPFMRKGIAGDWKNYFTVAQNERFDEIYKEKMAGCSLQFRTEI